MFGGSPIYLVGTFVALLLAMSLHHDNDTIKMLSSFAYILLWIGTWTMIETMMNFYSGNSLQLRFLSGLFLLFVALVILYAFPKLV